MAVAPIIAEGLLAIVFRLPDRSFAWGFGVGCGLGAVMVVVSMPPAYIGRWRQGADGERATARALRTLTKCGWRLVHDIQTERGNLDHVLVGPAGVFLLEMKNLSGILSVQGGVLTVRWHEDPQDGYDNVIAGARVGGRQAPAPGDAA